MMQEIFYRKLIMIACAKTAWQKLINLKVVRTYRLPIQKEMLIED
jgi:hypothetical protein